MRGIDCLPVRTQPAASKIGHSEFRLLTQVCRQLEYRYNEILELDKGDKGDNEILELDEDQERTDKSKMGAAVLIAITRLRQALSHPYLLERVIRGVFSSEDFESVEKQFAEAGDKIHPDSYVRKLVQVIHKIAGPPRKVSESSEKASLGCLLEEDPLLKAIDGEQDLERFTCSVCGQLPDNPITTKVCQDYIFFTESWSF